MMKRLLISNLLALLTALMVAGCKEPTVPTTHCRTEVPGVGVCITPQPSDEETVAELRVSTDVSVTADIQVELIGLDVDSMSEPAVIKGESLLMTITEPGNYSAKAKVTPGGVAVVIIIDGREIVTTPFRVE